MQASCQTDRHLALNLSCLARSVTGNTFHFFMFFFVQKKYLRRLKAIRATLESSPFFRTHEVSGENNNCVIIKNNFSRLCM